jgi:hypothetical protein
MCRPQGLATLSAVSATLTLGSLFQLPTLMGFALQSFSPFPRSMGSFELTLRPRAFLQNLSALYRRPGGFIPRKKPGLLLRSRRVSSGRDPLLSWVFWPSRYSPSSDPAKSIYHFGIPLSLLSCYLPHGRQPHESQGRQVRKSRLFPPKRTPACMTFLPTASATSLRSEFAVGYFFASRANYPYG